MDALMASGASAAQEDVADNGDVLVPEYLMSARWAE